MYTCTMYMYMYIRNVTKHLASIATKFLSIPIKTKISFGIVSYTVMCRPAIYTYFVPCNSDQDSCSDLFRGQGVWRGYSNS